ncbi:MULTISPECIES: hypothetical protein [Microbacterium]|uniref:hypothetical protein n=1 Tax=Microbacterium TaxID=33882 RepID=UPI001D17C08F|nr:hypothetical protein [Microbacterium testaceum]MCC4249179.1 hypothetical protein [Microbacterium testaceum]
MTRRRMAATAVAFAAALALAGCTPPAAEPTAWQGVVQTLAGQASSGDVASASTTLDQLEADVIAQRDAGTVSPEEAEAILGRIAAVRADLAALAPAPEPTVEQTEQPVTEDTAPEPTQSTVDDDDTTVQEPETPEESEEQGPGNSGKDKENKGKGNNSKGAVSPGKKDG